MNPHLLLLTIAVALFIIDAALIWFRPSPRPLGLISAGLAAFAASFGFQ